MDTQESETKVEQFLPKGYPQILIHGCGISNGKSVLEHGMIGGMLSTDIVHCLDRRFFITTGESCLVIVPFNSTHFQTVDYEEFVYYTIRTGQKYQGEFVIVKTPPFHHVMGDKTIHDSETYLPPQQISGAIIPNREQYDYIGDVLWLIAPSYERGEFPPSRTAAIARLVGVQGISYFTDLQSYIHSHYQDEAVFIKELVEKFPRPLNWMGKNPDVADDQVLTQIFLQSYQVPIVAATENILNGTEDSARFLAFTNNPSADNYNSLRVKSAVE